jgi:hypothetical protein
VTTAVAEPLTVPDEAGMTRSGGGATLDELVSGVWEDLALRGRAACPVCGTQLRRAGEKSGRCDGCASELH